MVEETLYTINGGELVALSQGPEIPRGLGSAIAYNLDSFVEQPGLAIGSWDQTVHDDRPAAMSFTSEGTIVSVIVAQMDGDAVSTANRVAAIHSWLSPMQLRDLSQLFTEPAAFYEGLWDMSPNATIALQERRSYIIVTAESDVAIHESIAGELGNAHVDFVHLDVFTSEGGDDQIIRWSPDKGHPLTAPVNKGGEMVEPAPVAEISAEVEADVSETAEDAVEVDAVEASAATVAGAAAATAMVDEVDDPPPPGSDQVVDLSDSANDMPPPPSADTDVEDGRDHHGFVPGRTYQIETLPQLFDPNDELLESISDEMFAVPGHLVLVDKLPERRRQPSPFENPGRYRWDADTELQTMLETNQSDSDGSRNVHLFVESDRQSGLATYVGVLTTAADNKAGRYSTSMWFDIEPKVNAPLWQLFRKGRLPELGDGATADLSTTAV